MWNRGFSIGRIAEAMSLNKSYVNDLIFDFVARGYTLSRGQLREQEIRFCVYLRSKGITDTKICELLDMRQSTLDDWWKIAASKKVVPSKSIPLSLRSEEEEVKVIKKAYAKLYPFGGAYHPVTVACAAKVHPDRVKEVLGDKS